MRSNIDAQITNRLSARVSLGGMMLKTTKPNGVDWTAYKLTWLARPDAPFYANNNPLYPNGDTEVLADGVNMMVQRSEEHTSALQSIMRRSYAVFRLTKKN